jgi:Tol biopolymer transport system component
MQPTDPSFIVDDDSPAWSADGASIAYVHVARDPQEFIRGQYQIWLYDIASPGARYVGAGVAPAWSPRGDSLLFIAGGSVAAYGVTTRTFSTLLSMGDITSFALSPVRPLLAVATDYSSATGATHIWLVPLDGGSPRDISTIDNEGSWHQPRFNPDGSRILHERFLQNTAGTELFTMDTSGTSAVRLTSDQLYDLDGVWSPDGTQIAYTRGTPAGPEVRIFSSNGSGDRLVLSGSKEPSWSPDGSKMVVAHLVGRVLSLWIVNADGSGATPLAGFP